MQKERNREMIIWMVLGACFLVMHVYKIGSIPYGINCDEMGMGYDAWCLANFGTDRYQNSYPVYLINFSGGQSALYAYLCAPLVALFGFSASVFRIPAVVCSILTIYFGLKLVGVLFPDNRKMKLLVFFLYTISPVFTMLFRIGLDCNLMIGFSTAFLYFLVRAVEKQSLKSYVLAGFVGGLVLYTYVLSHFVMPLFLVLAGVYLLYTRKMNWKQGLVFAVTIFVLAIPLLAFHVINMFDLEEMQVGIFTIPKLYRYRSDDMSIAGIWKNLKLFFQYTLVYDGIKYNSIRRFPPMYWISIPFIAVGMADFIISFVRSVKRKAFHGKALILFWFAAMFATGILLGTDGPIVYRMNAVYMAYLYFCAGGIKVVKDCLCKWKNAAGLLFGYVLIALYAVSFLLFGKYYFCDYTEDTYLLDWFNFELDEVLAYMEEMPEEIAQRTTYIGDMNFTYIYYLAGSKTAPQNYNELLDDEPYTLWLWTESYKNYRFNFPKEPDPAGNYIVPETSVEYIELYRNYGFEETHVGKYYVFINPWLSYTGENSECIISWDHGMNVKEELLVENEENTILSGWALDGSYGKVWDDILVEINGTYYKAEKMIRTDVAEKTENEALAECGFHFTLDTALIRNADNLRFICVNYQEKSCYVQNIAVSK